MTSSERSLPLILGTAQWSGSYGLTLEKSISSNPIPFRKIALSASSSGWVALDTAPAYGDAESIVGSLNVEIEVHSKLDPSLTPELSLSRSLLRLGRKEVDVMYFHDSRVCVDNKSLVGQASELVGAGVGRLGASVYEVDEFEISLLDDRIEVIQVPLNPLDRRFSNVLGEASTGGCSMIIRSVFLQGSLLMNPSRLPRRMAHLAPFVADFQAIAAQFNVRPAALVFAWLRSVGQPAGVVVGVDSLQDLEEISRAVSEPCDSGAVEMVSEMKVPSWPEVDPRRWV